MTTFDWFLLGHLVGDWMLQYDWMALGKLRGVLPLAGFAHYMVYTIVLLIALGLARPWEISLSSMLVVGFILFGSHWLIDGGDLARRWMRHSGQRNQAMVRVVIDQTLHLLVLGGVAAWTRQL